MPTRDAALVEEAAGASAAMQDQAAALAHTVGRFRLHATAGVRAIRQVSDGTRGGKAPVALLPAAAGAY